MLLTVTALLPCHPVLCEVGTWHKNTPYIPMLPWLPFWWSNKHSNLFPIYFPKAVGPSAAANHDDTGGSDEGVEQKRDATTVSVIHLKKANITRLLFEMLSLWNAATLLTTPSNMDDRKLPESRDELREMQVSWICCHGKRATTKSPLNCNLKIHWLKKAPL